MPNLNRNIFSGFNENIKYDLLREVCTKSFYRFVQEFWHIIVPQKPVWNWHIEYICQKLQGMFENVESGKPKDHDIILNLPPSSSKCVTGETLILTPQKERPASSIKIGDVVCSVDYSESKLFEQTVVGVESFETACVEVLFDNGRSVCCSLNHPFMTGSGWKNAEDIKPGDFAHTVSEKGAFDWGVVLNITPIGVQTVYGIEVEAEEYDKKNFITNGVCSHNSTLCSILFPCWSWIRFPEARLITASFSLDLSMDFARKSKLVMQSDLFKRCFGEFKFYPERADHYANQFGGSRHAFSTQISPTGRHAHMIIIDDPIDPNDLDRENQLFAVNHWLSRVVRTRTVDARVTPLFLVMQRLALNDPTGDWLAKSEHNPDAAKIFHIKLPASIEKGQEVKPPGLKRYYKEGLFDPIRLSYDVLANKKAWMSVSDYSAQYDQDPLPQEGLLFKVQNLIPKPADPLDPFISKVRYWDKAGTASKDACFTVGALMGRTARGKFYILDVIRGQWGPADREAMIAHTARTDGPKVLIGIEQEPGSAGIDSINLSMSNLAGFNVVADKASVNKMIRAEALAIQVEHSNVFLLEGGRWIPNFISEVRDFPVGPTKDQVDAVAGAFRLITGAYGNRTAGAL